MKKLIIPLLIIISLCACSQVKEETSVFTVNGESVMQSEIDYFTEKHRSTVISKFIYEHGAEFDESFWNREFDGTTPQKYLDSLVKEDVIKAKIQLALCRENKIYNNITYQGLYNLAVRYNNAHSSEGTVGINTISLDTFYDYYIDNGVAQLKNILEENELAPSQTEINEKLNDIKNKYPDKSQEELELIAKDVLVEEKYDKYIENLYINAKID